MEGGGVAVSVVVRGSVACVRGGGVGAIVGAGCVWSRRCWCYCLRCCGGGVGPGTVCVCVVRVGVVGRVCCRWRRHR